VNRVLAEVKAFPLYSQVWIGDADTTDLPDWPADGARVASSAHAVAVATRSDVDGDVTIRLVEGNAEPEAADLVFQGEPCLTSPYLELGNTVAATVARVRIDRIGYVNVRIFVRPADLPDEVIVLI
jgi:hypothetical protein